MYVVASSPVSNKTNINIDIAVFNTLSGCEKALEKLPKTAIDKSVSDVKAVCLKKVLNGSI
jgi:hypothetical protein